MLWNYLTVAVRNLKRDRLYSGINILGFAVGLMVFGLIAFFVVGEMQYDRFHANKDRIYHVVMGTQNGAGKMIYSMGAFGNVAEELRKAFPEIEETLRIFPKEVLIRRGDTALSQRQCLVDSSIFRVLTMPLVMGDSQTALLNRWSMVISESMAQRFFGVEDPIGQTLFTDNEAYFGGMYVVTGVFSDWPHESHLQFDCITTTYRENSYAIGAWGPYLNVSHPTRTYVLLQKNADVRRVEERLPQFAKAFIDANRAGQRARNAAEFDGTTFHFQSLNDVYLYSGERFGIAGMGSAQTVWMFTLIAFLILALACCNYTNLTIAQSLHRVREIGMRRVVGAHRMQVMGQFLGESVLTTMIAALVALGLLQLSLPNFSELIGRPVLSEAMNNLALWAILASVVFFIGIVAGGYPAIYISRFHLQDALGKTLTRTRRGAVGLRQLLVIFQFGVSIALVICTITLYRQMDYIQNKNLGFNRNLLVRMPIGVTNRAVIPQMEEIKRALISHPQVVSTTASLYRMGIMNPQRSPVTPEGEAHESRTMIQIAADEDFLQTIGVDLVSGRGFSKDHPIDVEASFLLNETAVRQLGWDPSEAIGKTFEWRWRKGQVVGVVADFNLEPLHKPIDPTFFMMWQEKRLQVTARISGVDITGTLAHFESVWKRFLPEYDFVYTFFNDELASHYVTEEKQAEVFGGLTFLAVIIACLGLLGLSAFSVQRRTKEIGIRKVLGASPRGLVALLSRAYLRDVLIAGAIAVPLGTFAANRWLEGFAYRVDVNVMTLFVSLAGCLLLALLTVGVQTLNAARLNPAQALRND